MEDIFSRTELILGKNAINKLHNSHVAVFGIGGVGGYTVEALARSGVGKLDLIDNDKIAASNINRQIIATTSTIGEYKVDVAARRIADINPQCVVKTYKTFFLPENAAQFDFSQYDYIVDAIDTVSGKIGLALAAQQANVPIISAMGAGNKINTTGFQVADIYETSVCPLAHIMRKELRRYGVKKLKVVYSPEKPLKPVTPAGKENNNDTKRHSTPGSTAFVPPIVGFIIAGEVIKDLVGNL